MRPRSRRGSALRLVAAGIGVAAGGYLAWAALSWSRFGRPAPPRPRENDPLLDRFIPAYDVVERHRIWVAAPAALTFAAACDQDLFQTPLIRAIFKARELVLGSLPDGRPRPRGLIAATRDIGWGVLAEVPGREIVMGAVTQPWEPDVRFQALPPDEFAAFARPGFVKIVWTLRADPLADGSSIFRTETRAVATDGTARARFRRYWALASPGIAVIRRLSLGPLRREAERRARASRETRYLPYT